MKCPICKKKTLEKFEDEQVCSTCGGAFFLELLGYYEEGSDDRIECGDEFNAWRNKWVSE